MNINDIIALAKAGYKPQDVKELIELTQRNESDHEVPEEVHTEEVPEDVPNAQNGEATQNDTDAVDYKALYESTQAELKKVQSDNAKKQINVDNVHTDEELFSDFARSFM